MTIDEALDKAFEVLTSAPNAASLGNKEIGFQEAYGIVVHSLDPVFIPTTSPNDGVLISRTRARTPPKSGQVEGGLAYTNITRLDKVSQPGGVDRLFQIHLLPPDGRKTGVVKAAGWIHHLSASQVRQEVREHLISEPEFDIETPGGAVLVTSDVNFDERFTRLRIVREALYAPGVVSYLVALVQDDLRRLPTYSL